MVPQHPAVYQKPILNEEGDKDIEESTWEDNGASLSMASSMGYITVRLRLIDYSALATDQLHSSVSG